MPVKRRKRKKKRHYHTGVYKSSKTGAECKFRSGWEEKYMQYLDADASVETWAYERVIIPYVSNKKTGKLRKYYPDFFVSYFDHRKVLVEIKPSKRVTQARVAKKLAAAVLWCQANGATLCVITEIELKGLGLL
jgi:hypothetical protein